MTKKQQFDYIEIRIPIKKKNLEKSKYYLKGFENFDYTKEDEMIFLLWLCSYCSIKNTCKKNLYDRLICVNNAISGKTDKSTKKLINDIFDKTLKEKRKK